MSVKEKLNEYVSILNADCLEYMRTVADNTFDLAVVDPDFGLNGKISKGGTWAAKYKGFDGASGGVPTKEYFDELFRISKNQVVWGGVITSSISSIRHAVGLFGTRKQGCAHWQIVKWHGRLLIRTPRYSLM